MARVRQGVLVAVLVFARALAAAADAPPSPPCADYGLWVDEARAAGVPDNTVALRSFLGHELTPARRTFLQEVLTFARAQVDRTAALLDTRPADEFPLRTDLATGEWQMVNATYWTAGHWVGMLWELHRLTGEAPYAQRALAKTERIGEMDRELAWSHDQGFLFGLSHVKAQPYVDEP